MRILIVGANGFLGRYLCQAYLQAKWEVDGIIHRNKSNVPKDVSIYSINTISLIKQYDVIIIAVGNFSLSTQELYTANIDITRYIIDKFPKSKIIYISSVAVYGIQQDVITEVSPFCNPTVYGQSKLAGEFVVKNHSLASIIRFSNLYGFGMNTNLFVPRIIQSAKKTKKIILSGRGKRSQDYLHVKDAVKACIAVAESPSAHTVLAAYGKSYSNIQVANIISENIRNVSIIFEGEDNSPSYMYQTSTMLQKMWKPKISIRDGLQDMIKYYA